MSDWASDEDVEKALRAQGNHVHQRENGGCSFTDEEWEALKVEQGEKFKLAFESFRAALRAVNPYEWRSIETAPKDGGYIVVARFGESKDLHWVKHSRWVTAQEFADEDGGDADDYIDAWDDDDGDACYPTHWLPLDVPPSPEGDK